MLATMVYYLLSLVEMNRLVKALYNTGGRVGTRKIKELKKKIMNAEQEECKR